MDKYLVVIATDGSCFVFDEFEGPEHYSDNNYIFRTNERNIEVYSLKNEDDDKITIYDYTHDGNAEEGDMEFMSHNGYICMTVLAESSEIAAFKALFSSRWTGEYFE
jgi:hypothetical protein